MEGYATGFFFRLPLFAQKIMNQFW